MSLLLRLCVAESMPMCVCFSLCVYEYENVQEYAWVSVQKCIMGGRVYECESV